MTSNDVRKKAFELITEVSPWEAEKGDAEEMTRQACYMCGIIDMAEAVCRMMDGKDIK